MKIELRKTTKKTTDGVDVFYQIFKDDKYVEGSTTMNPNVAEKWFELVKKGDTQEVVEVLKSETI